VIEYVLGRTIDLASGNPLALVIRLGDGLELPSNWANSIGYSGTDDASKVFAPGSGTVYSYMGDFTSTWAHSGVFQGKKIFASNFELFLRVKPDDKLNTLAEGEMKALSLVGSKAYLCQLANGEVKPFTPYDAAAGCPGKRLELVVTAAIIVPHNMVDSYDSATMTTHDWLVKNIPGAGFNKLKPESGWLLKFCAGQFNDQPSDGTPSYLFNRVVIGFTVAEK
jgi:hypothetical protein